MSTLRKMRHLNSAVWLRLVVCAALLCVCACVSWGARCAEQEASEELSLSTNFGRLSLPPGYDEAEFRLDRKLRLSLRDCILIALENNIDISISQYDPLSADAQIMSAWGEFDPIFTGQGTQAYRSTPSGSEYLVYGAPPSVEAHTVSVSLSLQGKVPTGAQYDLTYTVGKSKTTYNLFMSEYSANVRMSASQPLLRGAGFGPNLLNVRLARNSKEISEYQLQLTLMTTVAEVENAYWDLVYAIADLVVKEQSLATARDLLRQNEQLVAVGKAAPIEVTQAQAGVARREAEVIAAEAAIDTARDQLRRLMMPSEDQPFWEMDVEPVDKPDLAERRLDEALSIQTALASRPEILQARKALEANELQLAKARNDLLPDISLQGSYGYNALAPTWRESTNRVTEHEDVQYSWGAMGSMPIGNRMARGNYRATKYDVKKAGRQLGVARRDIVAEVRQAVRQVDTNRKLVDANTAAVAASEESLAAEQKKYQVGVSTSFQVLQVEEELALNRSARLSAIVNFRKSLVNLDRGEGTILKKRGIDLEND